MSEIKIIEHNVSTDEIIEREATAAELKILEQDKIAAERNKAEEAAKAQARQALLDKLGITEDEAKLLLGGN